MSNKLHLGSGGLRIEGYLNTDIDLLEGVDLALDASIVPYPFEQGSLDQIVNSHMLEHIDYEKVLLMVKEWYRILKPSGEVVIDVPDLLEGIRIWKDDPKQGNDIIYGNDERPTQHHRSGWTFETLAKVFTQAGFKEVKQVPSTDYHQHLGIPTFRLYAKKI